MSSDSESGSTQQHKKRKSLWSRFTPKFLRRNKKQPVAKKVATQQSVPTPSVRRAIETIHETPEPQSQRSVSVSRSVSKDRVSSSGRVPGGQLIVQQPSVLSVAGQETLWMHEIGLDYNEEREQLCRANWATLQTQTV